MTIDDYPEIVLLLIELFTLVATALSIYLSFRKNDGTPLGAFLCDMHRCVAMVSGLFSAMCSLSLQFQLLYFYPSPLWVIIWGGIDMFLLNRVARIHQLDLLYRKRDRRP